MSDTKKPKLSEIRAREQAPVGGPYDDAIEHRLAMPRDISYLLDLVNRMGKVLYHYRAICSFCKALPKDSDMLCYGCEEARELLKEIKQ